MTPLEFAEKILAIKDVIPMSVTSWGRTPARNARVGGHPKSYHVKWLGLDIVPDEVTPENLKKVRAKAKELGLEVIDEYPIGRAHWHIEPIG